LTRYRTIDVMSGAKAGRPADDRQFVGALERGLRVLRAFTSSRDVLSNGDLAQRTGLSKPTISRLTYTLARLGYLNHASDTGLYRLGSSTLALGYASLANFDVRQIARPLMQELADYAPGGVLLCARSGLDMICLELRRSARVIGLGLEIGDRMPIAVTAPGRAFLAALSKEQREPLLNDIRESDPARWPQVYRGIKKAIKEFSERGFCTTIGDWYPEIHSAAVPLNAKTPYGTLTVNIGGFASSLPIPMIEKDLGPRLVALSRRVDELLNASGSSPRSSASSRAASSLRR
jgi:DNA-binding IclR family transcriptional regulator